MGLPELARAMAISPGWSRMEDAVLVVRLHAKPLLALLGHLDEAQKSQIEALRWQIGHLLPRLKYVAYKQAEADCETLANQLLDRFGRDELSRFHFQAIPRGGLIVLGMLAYILDLRPSQLLPPSGPAVPLVITDDCSISGVRFSGVLSQCGSEQVVFAHLYSHPDLRSAIEHTEPRVRACVSAQDLADHAPAYYGDQYEAWQERWRQRPDAGYWVGQPDHICFSWNEPDTVVWNPVTQNAETAWRLLPPELCLKHRDRLASSDSRVQVQPDGKGPLRPAATTVFGELARRLIVANVETGRSFELSGVAADMWHAIVEHGTLESAEEALAANFRVEPAKLHGDLRRLVEDLRAQGLLEDSSIRVSRD